MKEINLIKQNIENLTSLWKAVSLPFEGYHEYEDFTFYKVKDSEWPNRLWFHDKVDDIAFAKADIAYFQRLFPAHCAYFSNYNQDPSDMLSNNLKVRTTQYGMYASLDNNYDKGNRIKLKEVVTRTDAEAWVKLFEESFKYKINPEQVLLPLEKTGFYLVEDENSYKIGTIITHSINQGVVGIHSMGIIPSARNKGYAKELMEIILEWSKSYGFKYAVLQASEMAVPLYEKLGFEHQFKMTNYTKSGQG